VKAQGVNVLPKANVEGAILEDYKLTVISVHVLAMLIKI
jgi:hypothetical protein